MKCVVPDQKDILQLLQRRNQGHDCIRLPTVRRGAEARALVSGAKQISVVAARHNPSSGEICTMSEDAEKSSDFWVFALPSSSSSSPDFCNAAMLEGKVHVLASLRSCTALTTVVSSTCTISSCQHHLPLLGQCQAFYGICLTTEALEIPPDYEDTRACAA